MNRFISMTPRIGLRLFLVAGFLAGLLVVSGTPVVYASSIVVNSNGDTVGDDGFCTLREAITSANTDTASGATAGECVAGSGADTITFDANYIITLDGQQLPTVTTEITINGNGAANTIVQASTCDPVTLPGGCTPATWRVFEVTGKLTLDSLTVQNGNCNELCVTDALSGGGIYNSGTVIMTNSTFSKNLAVFGGGILNTDTGSATLINSSFSGNFAGVSAAAPGDGGGILNDGILIATDSTFSGNTAFGSGANGGGISNGGIATITSSTFSGNSASGDLTGDGGGIDNNGTLTVLNSTFSGNSAYGPYCSSGGAIANAGTLTMTNSTLSGNSATNSGAGEGPCGLDNYSYGGGLYNGGGLNLNNTILANNSATTAGDDCYNFSGDTIATNVKNLIKANAPSGNMCGTPAYTADPNLAALANNGGPTQTMALQAGSPAIDTGDNTAATAAGLTTDQRGTGFPRISNLTVDIGAFELVADLIPPTITITVPTGTTYQLGQVVLADYICQDTGGSGLASCLGPVSSGSAIDTASVGPKTFTVNAADNASNTSTSTVSYDVVDASDFSISISPAGQTVAAGSSTAFTVSTAVVSGSPTSIALSISGLPAGVTALFNPASVSAGGSSTLTLTASALAAAGTTTFTVTGTSGSVIHTVTATLTVIQAHPRIAVDKQAPAIAIGGGPVTYTYLVTNPGNVPLNTVTLTDDKCSVGSSHTGDANSNDLLDPGETWTYTCAYSPSFTSSKLTNKATAKGKYGTTTYTAVDSETLYPFTLKKKIYQYWNEVSYWHWNYSVPYLPADNTSFSVELYKDNVLVGTYTISQNSPQKLWLGNGTYTFKEVNLPSGYLAADSSFTYTTSNGTCFHISNRDHHKYDDGKNPSERTFANIITYNLAIDKTGPATAHKGSIVTYNYTVTNTGLASVRPKVTDDKCSYVTYVSGDTDHDGRVDPGETWNFKCTYKVTANIGSKITNKATVTDLSQPRSSDLGGDIDLSNNKDTWTLTVN